MDAAISFAAMEDIPQLEHLVNSAYRGEAAKKGWTHEAELIEGDLRTDKNSIKELIQRPGSVILKYSIGKTITGCVHLEKRDAELYLGMLSVDPGMQGSGIGKKLLGAADEYAKEQGSQKIKMTVISIRYELIAWYERNGYHKISLTKPFHTDKKFGTPRVPIEFIVMEKEL